MEWPHIGEDFLNHTPNANTLHGAVCSSFWDLYDSTNDIDDWNFDTKTEPISDIWDSIKNTSNIINFCHYFKDNYYSTEIEKAYFDSLMLAHNIQDYLLIEDDAEWNDQAHLVDNDYIVAENTTLTIAPDIEVYFEYDNKITVYGELIIGDNVKFIGNQDRNSVEVYGSLQVGENVEFIAEEGFYWNGLYLNNCSEAITLNSPTFINNKLTSENTTIAIDKGYFINTNIEHNYKDLTISKTSFENSLVYAVGSYPMNTNEKLQIDNCFFSNETNNNAIYITSYKNYEIYADTIYTNGTGIFLNESGSGKTHLISNNVIKNYTENVNGGYGIKLYNCYADILGHNKIFNKLYGLAAINTCQLQVAGDYSPPFQEIHNNQSDETLFTHDSFPYKFKYCLIYDDNHDDYYIKCGDHSGRPHFIHNDMQTQASIPFDPNLDLYPSDAYDYEPMWDSGRDGEIAEAELLFDQALEQYDNESYYLAKQTFIEVISLYPDTRFAVASVRSLYSLEQYLENDFESLKNYYLSEPNMSFDDDMTNTSIFFANLCDIKLANFSQAIEHYENIILDPPSMADSIFAIIDAGYTYLIMEGRDSFMGNIPELKPDSRKLFIKKREILLDLLFEELNIDHDPQEDIEKITLHNNYPNPFNPNTTISFSLPEESKVELTIYNIKGQKVRSLVNEEMNRGIHRKLWNGKDSSGKEVSSGVYFYKLNVYGKTKSVKKCLLVK